MQVNYQTDTISVVGTAYFQPISDLIDKLIAFHHSNDARSNVGHYENGYAAALTILLVALLESFCSRLHFCRTDELLPKKDIPTNLTHLFPGFPYEEQLKEIFLLRNIVSHNHVWHRTTNTIDKHLDETIKTPKDLKFDPKQTYFEIVDETKTRTKLLGLHAIPTDASLSDVEIAFTYVWKTLVFMQQKNSSDTPLGGRTITYRGRRIQFEELLQKLNEANRDTKSDV